MIAEHVSHLAGHVADTAGTVLAAPPNPGQGASPPGVDAKVLTLLKWLAYFAIAACVAGVIITAGKMALAHRRGDDTNVSALGWVLAACVLVGSASAVVGALL